MRRLLILSVIAVIGISAAYVLLTTGLLPGQKTTEQNGNVVAINMTTRQWRFDVVSASPAGSAQFSSLPPTGQFANTTIVVHKGNTVIIYIKNLDVSHGFALEEFGINTVTPAGQTTEVKFVASEVGKFTFFCTVFCGTGHPLHKGTLIVEA